ncbi:hypothetical protein IWW34DRAFT_875518 [Fusarium oxysporum f. sp. albedinis]|nr:hypothetical protein IWW34DRAFT_875518 [Fusarium oxysporum f. sp. albedinis]KAK2484114.1 hypothetical protein H9L39_05906 [Fusarium oxysporum f. sp. albedinis]
MDQLMALLIELPPEARLRKVGYPSEADLTDASAYPSCLVPEAITYAFGTEAHFAFLFKICMRKCDENPICLFSPLCRLMSHPVFEMEGTNNLTLILQYAVICRTDDRRPWKMPPIPDVDRLKQLCGVMELCSGPVSTPISEIFASHCTNESPPSCIKARDLTADDPLYREQQDGIKTYLTDPKHLIFVMLQLAKVVQDSPKTDGPYITKERSFEVYSVTTLDLQNIRKALDTMELHCGEGSEAGLFEFPTDIIFPRYVAKTGVENDAPRDSEELSDLIVAGSMKREREIFDTILGRNRQ